MHHTVSSQRRAELTAHSHTKYQTQTSVCVVTRCFDPSFHISCPQKNKHATFFYSRFPSCWLWRHSVASVYHLFSKSLQQRHISSRPVSCNAVKIGLWLIWGPWADWLWLKTLLGPLIFTFCGFCPCFQIPSCLYPLLLPRFFCVEARLWTLLSCSLVSLKKRICALMCEKAKHLDKCRK